MTAMMSRNEDPTEDEDGDGKVRSLSFMCDTPKMTKLQSSASIVFGKLASPLSNSLSISKRRKSFSAMFSSSASGVEFNPRTPQIKRRQRSLTDVHMMAPDDLRAIMSLNLKSVDMDNSAELGTNPQPSIPWYILHPHRRTRCCWDLGTLFFLFFAAIQLPVVLCFQIRQTRSLLILTFVQDVFFVIDIGLNFFTAVEVDGEIVSNQRRIAVEYLRSWFLIDAGAVIGFPLVFLDKNTSNSDAVKLIKLLKLVRIVRVLKLLKLLKFMRLNRVISRLEFSFILRQHVLQILSFAVGVLLTCHVFACVFYAIGARNRRDGEFRRSSWISRNELDRASKLDRYIAAFYWVCSTVTTVGYGDIHAVATLERTWSIVVMIIGASIFAVGTSWAIHLCEQLQWRKRQFSTQIQSLNMFMDQHKIPDHLRAEVREDLISRHSKYALSVAEEHRLMENLSLDLRSKLSLELNVNYLKKIKFMHCANPEVIRGLAAKLHTAYFSAGDVIVHEGDIGDCMFFIVRGAVEVLVILDGTTTTKRVAMLSKNQFFGEGAVVGESQRRNATVRSIMFTEVRTLSCGDMRSVLDRCVPSAPNNTQSNSISFLNTTAPSSRRIYQDTLESEDSSHASNRLVDAMRQLSEHREATNRHHKFTASTPPTLAADDVCPESGLSLSSAEQPPHSKPAASLTKCFEEDENCANPKRRRVEGNRRKIPDPSLTEEPNQQSVRNTTQNNEALDLEPLSPCLTMDGGVTDTGLDLNELADRVNLLALDIANLKELQTEANSKLATILDLLAAASR